VGTKKRGFTLVEIICVTAIIAALAAITLPVYHRAKLSAKTTASVQRLHQFGIAISLYREQWGARGYNSVEALALPDYQWFFSGYGGAFTPPQHLASPCGYNAAFDAPWLSNGGIGYYHVAPNPMNIYLYERFMDRSLVVYDFQCNAADTKVGDYFARKRSLGLLLSGQVVSVFRVGDVHSWDFYAKPAE